MSYRYAVLGAGRQGVAAAYDMAKHGEAEEVLLVDVDAEAAEAGAEWINRLLDQPIAAAVQADASNTAQLEVVLDGVTSFLSAVPYSFNLPITEVAYASGFGSVRRFNSAVRAQFRQTPGDLRKRSARSTAQVPGLVPCGQGAHIGSPKSRASKPTLGSSCPFR